MAHPRTFRFGVDLQANLPDMNWMESAQEVERLGYSTLFVPDHFDEGLGPIAALAAAAAVTTKINVGTLVLACDFRHPAVLSREMATIDHISGGRLELGVGAGWKKTDYDATGLTMDRAGVRVDRMIEHVEVLRGMFAEGAFDFDGEHYSVTGLDGTPAPSRPGGPPILIGGGGRRVLSYAARNADIVGVNASIHSGEIDTAAAQDAHPDRIDEKVGWVRDAAGDRFADLELNAWLAVAEVTDDAAALADVLAPSFGTDPASVLESPLSLIGSADEIVARLQTRRDRWGYSYTVIPGDKAHDFAPIVAELTGT